MKIIYKLIIIMTFLFFFLFLFAIRTEKSSAYSERREIGATERTTDGMDVSVGVDGDDDSFAIHMNARPSKDDEYCTTQRLIPSKYQGRTIIGFVPLPGYAAHHIMVYRCLNVADDNQIKQFHSSDLESNSCISSLRYIGCNSEIMFVWANAGEPFYFPSNVGITIRKGETIEIVTHYGITTQPNWPIDRSGVRFVLKKQNNFPGISITTSSSNIFLDPRVVLLVTHGGFSLQPQQKSVQVGSYRRVPFSHSLLLPSVKHSFYLFAIRVHSHSRGIANEVHFFSDGTTTKAKFSYKRSVQLAQSFIPLKNIVEIHQNDFLEFACSYDTSHDSHHVNEGNTKHDEMCNVYLYGYIDKKSDEILMVHSSSKKKQKLEQISTFKNEIGKQTQIVGVTTSSSSHVYALTRADRIWDSSSFDNFHTFLLPPIKNSVIFKLDANTGKLVKKFGEDLFRLPHSIRLDPFNENLLYVIDVGWHTISVFDLTQEKIIRVLGSANSPGVENKQFCKPTDVTFSKHFVYVSDGYCNYRVVVYDRMTGEFVKVIQNFTFQLPHAVSIVNCEGGEEYLLICSREGKSLQVLSTASFENKVTIKFTHYPYAVTVLKNEKLLVGLVERKGNQRIGYLYVSETSVCSLISSSSSKNLLNIGENLLVPLLREPHEFSASKTEENVFYVAEAVDGELTGDLLKYKV